MSVGDMHNSHPKSCPNCRSRKITAIPETISGLRPWRCRGCGKVGYENRMVGDPTGVDLSAPEPRPRKRQKEQKDRYQ